jgi:hypothetical protein
MVKTNPHRNGERGSSQAVQEKQKWYIVLLISVEVQPSQGQKVIGIDLGFGI